MAVVADPDLDLDLDPGQEAIAATAVVADPDLELDPELDPGQEASVAALLVIGGSGPGSAAAACFGSGSCTYRAVWWVLYIQHCVVVGPVHTALCGGSCTYSAVWWILGPPGSGLDLPRIRIWVGSWSWLAGLCTLLVGCGSGSGSGSGPHPGPVVVASSSSPVWRECVCE